MSKYLYTDGNSGVKELLSQEELHAHIESAPDPGKIRIWIFNSNEWVSYTAYQKNLPFISKKELAVASSPTLTNYVSPGRSKRWLKKFLIICGGAAGIFLIFNFTKIKWEKAAPVYFTATQPVNVPVMDIDSLIMTIEDDRGILLDRSTRTNLRLRNTWPESIELRLNAEKETAGGSSRYFHVDISIDNTTGFNLDEAIVRLNVWKNGRTSTTDTLRFNNIRYDQLSARQLRDTFRGDSITVFFESIRAKAFNFCYSANVKNNSGNYNDRWFCRE
jgi:hypothetical protein